jgi:hypothetical protein
VEFEDGLSMSLLEKQGNSPQKFTTGNRKVSKKVKWVQRPPVRFTSTRLFQTLVCVAIGQNLAHQYMSKERSQGDGFLNRFY